MHPEQNDSIMVITKQVQEILDATPPGKVLTIADFNVLPEYQPALVKALSRLVAEGSICKIAKGRYYKPKQTVFGTLKPPVAEVVKDLLERQANRLYDRYGSICAVGVDDTDHIGHYDRHEQIPPAYETGRIQRVLPCTA